MSFKNLGLSLIAFCLLAAPAPPLCAQQAPAQVREETPVEFVDRNLARVRKLLADAKARYRECCGLADLIQEPVDPASILASLPKPHQLKFILRYPEKKIAEIQSQEQELPPSWSLYPGYASLAVEGSGRGAPGYDVLAAADDLTSSLLRLRRTLPVHATAELTSVNGQLYPVKDCCLEFRVRTNADGSYKGADCIRTAQESYMTVRPNEDPRAWAGRIGYRLSAPGGELSGNGAAVRFNRPGAHAVTATLPSLYLGKEFKPQEEQYCLGFDYTSELLSGAGPVRYRLNPQTYRMSDRWGNWGGYRPVIPGGWQVPRNQGGQSRAVTVDVVAFAGIYLDGKDYPATGAEATGFDLFAREGEEFKAFRFEGKSAPGLILRRAPPGDTVRLGDSAGGPWETVEPFANWNTALSYHLEGGSVFSVSQQGDVRALGSVGEARLTLQMGQHWSLRRKITANRWQAVLEPMLADGNVAPGGRYRVTIQVTGAADMAKYRVKWTGGRWQNPGAGFVQQGVIWRAENVVTIPGDLRPGSYIELAAEASVGGDPRLTWSRQFLAVPSLASVELLLAAKGRAPSPGQIDLFFPNYLPDGNRFMALPRYRNAAGELLAEETSRRFLALANLRLASDTPAVAMVDGNGGQVGRSAGEAWITAELGGADLDPRGQLETAKGEALISNSVKVTGNQLLLSRGKAEGGFTPYALRVIGPAPMEKYQALFHYDGGSTGTPFRQGADGGYLAGISSAVAVQKVEILHQGRVVAMLPVNDAVVLPEAGIKLMPITVPGRVIDSITLVDLGSLTTSSECRKQLRTQYPGTYGKLPDSQLDSVCDNLREAQKQEIKEQREVQKDQQKILKSLQQEGRQLMVFADATQLGAAVSGNFDPDRMHCRWRVDQGGSIKFEQAQSPITRVGVDGACFNDLKGFQGDFNTEATAVVELIYAHPAAAAGQFIPGGTQTMRADVDGRQVEAWVNN
jgi:hypothetical protein